MSHRIVQGVLASPVADAGTFTVSYPAKVTPESGVTDEGDFYLAIGHKLVINQAVLAFPNKFDITLGTGNITITNKSGATWAAGSAFVLELQEQGKRAYRDDGTGLAMAAMSQADQFLINLGSPDLADTDGIVESQNLTALGVFSVNTTAAAAIAAAALRGVMDVPRNVVAAWTGTAVLTITGTDLYGNVLVESSASGTSMFGAKAFKTVTGVASSANITALTVGSGNALGLPVFLPSAGNVIAVLRDGVLLPKKELIQGEIDEARLIAGTSVYVQNANAGNVERLTTVLTTAINTTGGTLTVEIGGVAVTGLAVVITTGSPGEVDTDQPAAAVLAGSDTKGMVAARAGIEIVGDAAFDSTGALNFLLELNTEGIIQPGIRTAGGSTATTGDVRGTFLPVTAPDGAITFQILAALPDPGARGISQYAG